MSHPYRDPWPTPSPQSPPRRRTPKVTLGALLAAAGAMLVLLALLATCVVLVAAPQWVGSR
jgi:hypothetical protein